MSTIRIDEKHQKLLDKLIANMILRGRKMNKKKIIGELIENALISEGIPIDDKLRFNCAIDSALLQKCFELGEKLAVSEFT